MDFYKIREKFVKKDLVEIYPDFQVIRSKDLMIRGRSFYAIWDEERGIWSTDEYDVQRLVDRDLEDYYQNMKNSTEAKVVVKKLGGFSTNSWSNFKKYIAQLADNAHQLDENLTFANTKVLKKDHVSRRLPYSLEEGSIDAYDELIGTLFSAEERRKLEWAVGSIISGASTSIQKFIVLYGDAGSGKSTFLNIVQKLFPGYYTTFEAKALVGSNNTFSTEIFKDNPLVAIQHDGDLSKIEDNTKLNSIISHEEMNMNEKYKPGYMFRINAFLFMGTNKPVKITDSKSGIIRRLINVSPSGNKVTNKRYHILMSRIDFELGAIAHHCLQVFTEMGKNYYSGYKPVDMMFQTDTFFNFIEEHRYFFKDQDGCTLTQAYDMYKVYCDEALIDFKLPKHKFREELKSYFKTFQDIARIDGKQIRSYYSTFLLDKLDSVFTSEKEEHPISLTLDEEVSLLDQMYATCPAQYSTNKGDPKQKDIPKKQWSQVDSKLEDLNTRQPHYVKFPKNHIVIDFDIKDVSGKKSPELNIEAASKWPPTYAEYSKSEKGIHLHYLYDGDVSLLTNLYSPDIEIKKMIGDSAVRRKLTKCNNLPVASLTAGQLPLKGEKMINFEAVLSERALRDLIVRNINKEIHPGTKPSIDFIFKLLDDAYSSGMSYDVTNLRPKILAFANNSTNQSDYCVKLVNKMPFHSEEPSGIADEYSSDELIFFDTEVFPNLFVVCWKAKNKESVRMINPSPKDIEALFKFKLIGFNCRRYDNHILYARYIGYDNPELYALSQKLVNNSRNATFAEAYKISYTDVFDFSSIKMSLKKFQIKLGIHHKELGLSWDEPVPEELWDSVAEYCVNDVTSLEEVFEDRKQDFIARLILSDLSGLTPNHTTAQHSEKIFFGDDKKPQDKFVYTDLNEMFPGYIFEGGKSTYRGEETGEGGYVYAEPGMYVNVAVLDVESMHPRSTVEMNMFGPYTKKFKELMDARLAIKHQEYDSARTMLGGILNKYLDEGGDSKGLSYALKIIINSVYGLTAAKFDNKFKDPRNKDNIVAKRGALFMIDLKHAVQERGAIVAHIKTDSIKIPNVTPEIIDFVVDFGKKYGYTFEHEATYEKFCLINDAVYIASLGGNPSFKDDIYVGPWTATGAQFAEPYVFKTLFSKEPVVFEDLIQTKAVTTALYLDMNEELEDVRLYEKELSDRTTFVGARECTKKLNPMLNHLSDEDLIDMISRGHNYRFVGKVGAFCPIKIGCGGGILLRSKDGRYYAATGSKGYRWLEAEVIQEIKKEQDIDMVYYQELVASSKEDLARFGDVEWFLGNKETFPPTCTPIGMDEAPPWGPPCKSAVYTACVECARFITVEHPNDGRDVACKLGYKDPLPF